MRPKCIYWQLSFRLSAWFSSSQGHVTPERGECRPRRPEAMTSRTTSTSPRQVMGPRGSPTSTTLALTFRSRARRKARRRTTISAEVSFEDDLEPRRPRSLATKISSSRTRSLGVTAQRSAARFPSRLSEVKGHRSREVEGKGETPMMREEKEREVKEKRKRRWTREWK